jgi:hypothetical protein
MNADIVAVITKTTTSNAKTAVNVMYTATRQLLDLAYPATSGRSLAVDASGRVDLGSWLGSTPDALSSGKLAADIKLWLASAPNALISGRIDANVQAMANNVVTAAVIATDAIDADALKTDAVTEIQSGLSTLDAAGVRSAVGLASANLDTQLSTIAGYIDTEVAAILAAVDTEIAAIKAQTDQLVFTNTNKVDAAILNAADLATAVRVAIADAMMTRASSNWEGSTPAKSLGAAIMKATHRIRDNAGTLETYLSDGTTIAFSQTVTTDPSNEPIDELSGAA